MRNLQFYVLQEAHVCCSTGCAVPMENIALTIQQVWYLCVLNILMNDSLWTKNTIKIATEST